MTTVTIPGVGPVKFPEGMSEAEISNVIQREILPGIKPPKPEPGIASEIGSILKSGTGQGIASLGKLGQYAGIGGKGLEEYGTGMTQRATKALSPGTQASLQRQFIKEAPEGQGFFGYQLGDAGIKDIPAQALQSIPMMAGTMAAAAGATALAPEAAVAGAGAGLLSLLGRIGLGNVAGRIATAAGTKAGAAELLAGKLAINTLAGNVGEGLAAAGSSGIETEKAIHDFAQSDPDSFFQSPIGQQALKDADGDKKKAIELGAFRAGRSAAAYTGVSTAILATPGSAFESLAVFGKGVKSGRLHNAIMGGITEGPAQELPQGSAEQYIQNLQRIQAGEKISSGKGVLEAGVQGAIIGTPIGGALGAITGSGKPPAEIPASDVDMAFVAQHKANLEAGMEPHEAYMGAANPVLAQAPEGAVFTVYDSTGESAEARLVGRQDGTPLIQVDAAEKGRNYVLGDEFTVTNPLNAAVTTSDGIPVSSLSGEALTNKVDEVHTKVLANDEAFKQSGIDNPQYHIDARDLTALTTRVQQEKVPLTDKQKVQEQKEFNKQKREVVKSAKKPAPPVAEVPSPVAPLAATVVAPTIVAPAAAPVEVAPIAEVTPPETPVAPPVVAPVAADNAPKVKVQPPVALEEPYTFIKPSTGNEYANFAFKDENGVHYNVSSNGDFHVKLPPNLRKQFGDESTIVFRNGDGRRNVHSSNNIPSFVPAAIKTAIAAHVASAGRDGGVSMANVKKAVAEVRKQLTEKKTEPEKKAEPEKKIVTKPKTQEEELQDQVDEETPTLPAELAKATPRFNVGLKSAIPTFASDVDKAAFIVSGKGESARHQDYFDWVMKATGLTKEQVIDHGNQVRREIKDSMEDVGKDGTLYIPENQLFDNKHDRAIGELSDLSLGDLRKSEVTAFANRLVKQGLVKESDLSDVREILKDKDQVADDAVGELESIIESSKPAKFSKTTKGKEKEKGKTTAAETVAKRREATKQERVNRAIPRIAKLVSDRLAKIGLGKYIDPVVLEATIGEEVEGKQGSWTHLITLAVNGKSDNQIMSALNHESIHAMREIGMITPDEWKSLTAVAKAKDWITLFNIEDRYAKLSEDDQYEEAIADAWSTYATGRSPIVGYESDDLRPVYIYKAQLKLGGQPVGILTRIKKILGIIKDVAAEEKLGEDVFKRIEEAPIAATKPVQGAAPAKLSSAPKTPEFKKLFAGSKVVDKNGEPLPVYHGSQKFEDDQFKPDVKAVNRRGNVAGYYFTPNPEEASDFAINRKTESYDEGAQVLPVYLIIKNPYEIGVSRVTPDMVNQYRKEMIDLNQHMSDEKIKGWAESKIYFLTENGYPYTQALNEDGDAYQRILKAGGYDGFKDGRHWVAFYPNQIKSIFNEKPTTGPKISFSLALKKKTITQRSAQDDLGPVFVYTGDIPDSLDEYLKESTIKKNGLPRIGFHGTAQDISTFRAKQAGAIFVTFDPSFAEGFAMSSEDWMKSHWKDILTSDQQDAVLKEVENKIKSSRDTKVYKQKMLDLLNNKSSLGYAGVIKDMIFEAVKEYMPSGGNIMPLFVNAKDPFDYENETHVQSVIAQMIDNDPNFSATEKDRLGATFADGFAEGQWTIIESPAVQEAIKDLGYDSFYINEASFKNLAVYNSSQLKSAIGNNGEYDPKNDNIKLSVTRKEPTEEQKATARVKASAKAEANLNSTSIFSSKYGNDVDTVKDITPNKLQNLHRRATAIINTDASKAFFKSLGAHEIKAIPISGMWMGEAESSFMLTAKDEKGDSLPFEKMRGLSNILAWAFQQDAAITSEAIAKPQDTKDLIPSLYFGKGDKENLTPSEIAATFKTLTALGIDGASVTPDNKAVKLLYFGDEIDFNKWTSDVLEKVSEHGIKAYHVGYTYSTLDTTLRKTKNGNDSETNKRRGSEAWDTDVTGGSSVLFGRATDTFLVPYLLSVQAEGGRFDFDRWQSINKATKRERVALEQKVLAYQTIVEEAGLSPEEAASVNLLIGRTGLTGSDTFAIGKMGGIPEIVRYLDTKRKESGLRILDTTKEEDRVTLAKMMAAEALAAMRGAVQAIDWYDADIQKTLDILSIKYNELKTSPQARLAMRMAMAISSQTLNVEDNFRFAIKQYEHYRKFKEFPEEGTGKSLAPMASNFATANRLLRILGIDGLHKFLVSDFTVKELGSMGIKVGGELQQTKLLGSVTFGPKIGYGFLSNLLGNFEPTTFDMWFMRTIGRLTGQLPVFKQELYDAQMAKFRAALDERGTNGVFADKFDLDLRNAAKRDDAKVKELVDKIVSAHEKDYIERRKEYDKKYGTPTRFKSPLVSAAFAIKKSLEKPRDAPSTGTERNNLRDVMTKFVANVTKLNDGVRVPPAALQALIWHPEQQLYESLGARLRVTGQSYSGAAEKILKEGKISSSEKNDIEEIATRPAVPGKKVAEIGKETPFTPAQKDDFLQKYKGKFNIQVKTSDDAEVIQDEENEQPSVKPKPSAVPIVKTEKFSMARYLGDETQERASIVPSTQYYALHPNEIALAYYQNDPVRLLVGRDNEKRGLVNEDAVKPYGLFHLLGNLTKTPSRSFENITDNQVEDTVLGVIKLLGAKDIMAYSETPGRIALRSPSNKRAIILGKAKGFWSIVTVVPSERIGVFGNQINFREKVEPIDTKAIGMQLLEAVNVRSVTFKLGGVKTAVAVKKTRTYEVPKLSATPRYATAAFGGRTIPIAWQTPATSGLNDFIWKMQDKFIDLKTIIKTLDATVGKVSDQFNAYLKEELFHGRVAKRTNDFQIKELRPLLAEMKKRNVEMADIEKYLHNRHAEERNDHVNKIGGMADGGSGIKTKDAQDYMRSLSSQDRANYEALAKMVDKITADSRKMLVDTGLEDQKTVDAWNAAYDHYVPLNRVQDDDMDANSGRTGMGQGFSVIQKVQRALGSSQDVEHIIANIAALRERIIVKAEKNEIGKAVFGLALKYPNSDIWLAVDPEFNKSPTQALNDLLSMGYTLIEAQNLAAEPMTRDIDPNTGQIIQRVNPLLRNGDNVLHLMYEGKEKLVFFNKRNPTAVRLIKSLKNLDVDTMGVALGSVAKVTRYFAAINTQYNPIFGIINLLRDISTGMLNLTNTPLAGQQGKVFGNIAPAMAGIWEQLRAEAKGNIGTSKWAMLFNEFELAGGPTGYRDMFATSGDRADALAAEFKQLSNGRIKVAGKVVFDALSDYNTAMENGVRLSAYAAARDKGMSIEQAASLAKNLTVNFNRKGDVTTQMGALYAFFNASVQGTARIAQTLAGPAGRKIIGGGLLLGSVQAMLLAANDFGDDEPPDFVKQKNLIIPTGDGKYITIPMPLGFNLIPNFSRVVTEVFLSGGKNIPKKLAGLLEATLDGLNPIGGGTFAQIFSPTIADPIIAISENQDAFGRRIAKKDISGLTPTPGYLRTKETATIWSKELSKFLNYASGGTEFKKGLFSPTPDQLDYLIGQGTGGIGRELGKASQVASTVYTGEELASYKIPLVSRFYGDTKESASEANKFYTNITRINEHGLEIKGYRTHPGSGNIGEYMKENPEARLVGMASHTAQMLQNINAQKKKALERDLPKERIKQLEDLAKLHMKRFNDRVEALQ